MYDVGGKIDVLPPDTFLFFLRTGVAFSSSPAAPIGLSIISSSSRRFRTPDDHRSLSKSVGIEPRNLMEVG